MVNTVPAGYVEKALSAETTSDRTLNSVAASLALDTEADATRFVEGTAPLYQKSAPYVTVQAAVCARRRKTDLRSILLSIFH